MKHQISKVPFLLHSTFRDFQGRQLVPDGLEWGIPGESFPAFVPANGNQDIELDSAQVRRGLVEAYNRWCYAKDLPFKREQDIQQISKSEKHVHVKWVATKREEKQIRHCDVAEFIKLDAAVNGGPPVGFVSMLTEESLPDVLKSVSQMKSVKICLKRSDGLLRIEKYFSGMIRGYQVFDHLLDNLFALEDPELLDENTIIGTVTLPDWIMGGNLTSRLWVQQTPEGDILTLRPLRNDDISTSDRTYRLVKGQDDDKIAVVKQEVSRLKYLAMIPLPVTHSPGGRVKPSELESVIARQHRRNQRKKFGL